MVDHLRLEMEVGKPPLVLLKQGIHAGVSVPDLAGGDDLVAGMRKGCDATVKFVSVLRLHVLEDRRLTPHSDGGVSAQRPA